MFLLTDLFKQPTKDIYHFECKENVCWLKKFWSHHPTLWYKYEFRTCLKVVINCCILIHRLWFWYRDNNNYQAQALMRSGGINFYTRRENAVSDNKNPPTLIIELFHLDGFIWLPFNTQIKQIAIQAIFSAAFIALSCCILV